MDYFVPVLKSLVNKLYLLKMSIPCTNQTLEDVVVMMLEEKGKSIEEDVDNLYKVLGTFEGTVQRCLSYVLRAKEAAVAAGQKMEAADGAKEKLEEIQRSLAEFTESEIQANLKKTAERVVKQMNREAEDMRQ